MIAHRHIERARVSDFAEALGAAVVQLRGPKQSKLLLGAEFLQEPRHFKEVPGQFFPTTAIVPTTLSYFVRIRPGNELPLNIDLGVVQLGGKLGTEWNIQARHQFTIGVTYRL